jgi:processive 1,2-diacylglycerol beta-glucosyltransferase
MSKRRKIFILYARFGEGHWQAASSLKISFAQQGNTDVRLIDLLAESHPFLNEFSRFVYMMSYHVWPQAYGWVYEATKGMKSDSLFASWLHSFGAETIQKLIEREQPDAIIHTFPNLALPSLRARMVRKIPIFNVITDFDLHLRWVHPEVDKYYVATEDISKQLCSLGIHPNRISATGIPIHPSFSEQTNKQTATYPHDINAHKPIVLVLANPAVAWTETAEKCRRIAEKCDSLVIIVCGRNRSLERTLTDYFVHTHTKGITVLGYVDRMDELMMKSTCIVTKPGGLTLSESLTAELPIFLYRPVPGQERNNARYLASRGAAVICHTVEQLASSIAELIHVPERRIEMQLAASLLRKKEASNRIALDIAHELHIME